MSTIPQLEQDLVAAAGRRAERSGAAPRGWRALAAAALAVLCLVGAAGAATGVWSVGTVLTGKGFFGAGDGTAQEAVVATGRTPAVGRWRITTFRSEIGGSCLKLTLADRPAAAGGGPRDAGYCGGIGRFEALGGGTRAQAAGDGHVIVWGVAPPGASAVRLTAAGVEPVEAPVQRGPGGADGDRDPRGYWLLAAPTGLERPRVRRVDASGEPAGRPIDLASRFRPPTGRTVVATGTAPVAGPWRMVDYESARHVSEGDLYQPEGLPCLLLVIPRESRRSGQCGEFRGSPGFGRNQHTVRDPGTGEPRELLVYGPAPARADRVEIAKPGLPSVTVPARPGPAGVPGRFWLAPLSPEYAGGHATWAGPGARGPALEILPP